MHSLRKIGNLPDMAKKNVGPQYLAWQLAMSDEEALIKCEEYAIRLDEIAQSIEDEYNQTTEDNNSQLNTNKNISKSMGVKIQEADINTFF